MAITVLIPRISVSRYKLVDSIRDFDWKKQNPDFKGENDDVLVTFAKGRVVGLREMNGYDDSDFYATYMDEDGTFREYQYASTRGWTYANSAAIDATPEVWAAWEAKLAQDRENARMARERHLDTMAEKAKLTRAEFDKLRTVYHDETLMRVHKLLSTNLRSDFRKKMAEQVRSWLADPEPTYRTPLSMRQLYYV